MPTLELSSEELSLLQMCVALVLGGVFQDKIDVEKISNPFIREEMKTYRCAYCGRRFELSDDAVPQVRNGQYACEMCIVEME